MIPHERAVVALVADVVVVVVSIARVPAPAASYIGDTVHVFDPVAYAASLLCIVPACVLAAWVPTLRAARIDPIATLKHD